MDTDSLPPLPQAADLRRLVHFSSSDGRIWLAGNRMLLLHVEALGSLRKELMRAIGAEQTKRVLKRAGYASGSRDAALARQVRPGASTYDQFAVGPQLHMLEGAVQVTRKSSSSIWKPAHITACSAGITHGKSRRMSDISVRRTIRCAGC